MTKKQEYVVVVNIIGNKTLDIFEKELKKLTKKYKQIEKNSTFTAKEYDESLAGLL